MSRKKQGKTRQREKQDVLPQPAIDASSAPVTPSIPVWIIFGLPIALALILRVAYFRELFATFPFYHETKPGFDQHTYNVWAQQIAEGDVLSRKQGVFYYAPLYPYILAIAYVIAGSGKIVAGLVLNALFGILATVCAAGIARRIFGDVAALAGGCIIAACGSQIAYEGILLNDAILTGIVLAGLWAFLALPERQIERTETADPGSNWRGVLFALATGLIFSIAIAGRASYLLPVGLLILVFTLQKFMATKNLRSLLLPVVLGLGCILLPAAMIVRNGLIGDMWVITSNGPINFYIGNAPGSDGVFTTHENFDAASKVINKLPAAERGEAWRKQLREELKAHPGALRENVIRKISIFFNSWDSPDNMNVYFLRRFLTSLKFTIGPYLIYLIGFAGMILTWRSWRKLLPLYIFFLGTGASLILVFVAGRYKLPCLGILSIFGGGAIAESIRLMSARKFAGLAPGLVTLVIGAYLFYPRAHPADVFSGTLRANEYLMNVQPLIDAGRADEARALLEDGVDVIPNAVFIHERLAHLIYQNEEWETLESRTRDLIGRNLVTRAIAELHTAALLNLGRVREAQAFAAQVSRAFPDSVILSNVAQQHSE